LIVVGSTPREIEEVSRMMELQMPAYTVKEAERISGLSKHRIYDLIQEGRIDSERDINNQIRISYEALMHYLNTN
jgi:excisionase family DNA binding protein